MTSLLVRAASSSTVNKSATAMGLLTITMSLLTAKEPAAPIAGSVKVAAFNAASFMVPELRASELVAT